LVAGVASGLGEHLGLSLLSVRVAFVALGTVAGFGVALYAALWVCVPLYRAETPSAPGLAAAERAGMRASARRFRVGDAGQLVAFGALALGLTLLVQTSAIGVNPVLFWPALVIGCGVLLIWRQGDDAAPTDHVSGARGSLPWRRRDVRDPDAPDTWSIDEPVRTSESAGVLDRSGARGPLRTHGWRSALRILAGGALVLGGLVTFVATSGRWGVVGDVLLGGLVAAVGIALIAGPWLLQTYRSLRLEREERILSQERADVAAHLHDSVLQTLALIQRQAQDPREVVRLARSQERDLRGWLYGQQQTPDSSLRAAFDRVAAEVEEEYGIPVEVVVVGDCSMNDHLQAVVQAAREALVNAAKHASADRTDVYVEVDERAVVAYVRDRGVGFDPVAVEEHRLGVRRSIVERMDRHGGRASVRSAAGEGTEVRLEMVRSRS